MLMNLHKRNWTEGLTLRDFKGHKESNEKSIKVRFRPPVFPDSQLFFDRVTRAL